MTTAKQHRPIIAAMIGDPAGIGPEVCAKAVATGEPQKLCRPVLIGDARAIASAIERSALSLGLQVVRTLEEARFDERAAVVLDPGDLRPGEYVTGQPSAAGGRAVVRWIRLADQLAQAHAIDGWIMGPVDSTSLKLANEIESIDDLQPPGTWMFRISGPLRVVPITEHIRLRDVPGTVTRAAVFDLIRLVDETLRRWGIAEPRIGVAGLNPHAMFEEDAERIAPAVSDAQQSGINCKGPISPDSIFRQGLDGHFDAIVSMYHDQGQIALKSAAFEGACTIYMGLHFVRLSVPHGTAMDIAGQGKAQHLSMLAAMKTAALLAAGGGFLKHS
ncbi:MAG TPA: 4-hydroxythreonine-4-phosphate dehydrogenase PdxA [Candidatus Binataceae bacterium]|nr:4-hydroxythreonine-4-phosphate dehydrogenase PdxA [Candidatus Binataceae bacterium]